MPATVQCSVVLLLISTVVGLMFSVKVTTIHFLSHAMTRLQPTIRIQIQINWLMLVWYE